MALVEIPTDAPVEGGSMTGWTIGDYLDGENLNRFPWLADRDSDVWAATPYTWRGEQILAPFAGDMRPATRASVAAIYGPLTAVPHCTTCGSEGLRRDGTCPRQADTIAHPNL
jgi:hypothetical protein